MDEPGFSAGKKDFLLKPKGNSQVLHFLEQGRVLSSTVCLQGAPGHCARAGWERGGTSQESQQGPRPEMLRSGTVAVARREGERHLLGISGK